jgi:hypothetical protein
VAIGTSTLLGSEKLRVVGNITMNGNIITDSGSSFTTSSGSATIDGFAGVLLKGNGTTGLSVNSTGTLVTITNSLTLSALSTGVLHSSVSGVVSSSLIVNADVNASAAIDGSKINSTFGAQNVSTTTGFVGPSLDTGTTSDLLLKRNGTQIASLQSTGLSVTGSTTSSTVFLGSAGTAGAPTYSFSSDTDTGLYNVGANVCGISTNGVVRLQVSDNTLTFTQAASNTDGPSLLVLTGGAHNPLTASSEVVDVNVNLARTVTFSAGALTTQRAMLVQAPTYAFVSASTLTNTATLAISGAPIAGTNATITNTWALWVQGGATRFDGTIDCPGVGTNSLRIGSGTTAIGLNAIAIGTNAAADNSDLCIGTNSSITGGAAQTVVIGHGINTASSFGTTIGYNAINYNSGVSIGQGASSGTNGVAVGRQAGSGGSGTICIGDSSTGSGTNNIGIGRNSSVSGSGGAQDSIGIGASCATGFGQVICIGSGAAATAANQALLGGANTSITNLFIGKGVSSATPATNVTIQSTAGSGAAVSGSNLILTPGKAGDAATAGGLFKIQTSPAGSGTSLVDALTVAASGAVTMTSPTINYGTSQNGVWKNSYFQLRPPPGGAANPVLTQIGTSPIYAMKWAVNDKIYLYMSMPHDYTIGTNIYFIVNWFSDGTSTNTVVWQLTYYFARGNAQDAFALGGAGTVISITQAPTGTAYTHMTAESAAITIANLEPDAMIIAELKRVTNGGTDNTNGIFAIESSIAYQSNTPGTKNRNPNFYT